MSLRKLRGIVVADFDANDFDEAAVWEDRLKIITEALEKAGAKDVSFTISSRKERRAKQPGKTAAERTVSNVGQIRRRRTLSLEAEA